MRFSPGVALGLGVSAFFGAVVLAAGCSSTSATPDSDGGATEGRTSFGAEQQNGDCRSQPEKLTGTATEGASCQTFADCAPVCCACSVKGSSAGFSAAACINGACVGANVACPVAKKADYCPLDPTPAPTSDGGAGGDGAVSPTNPVNASFCVPISVSHATDRGASRTATTDALVKQLSTAPGPGSIDVSRNAAGKPTSIRYNASGGAPGYTVSLTYDSAGNLTYLRRSPSGAGASDTHSFTYDSRSNLTYFRKSWSDSQPSETESFTYDSKDLPTYYRQSWSDSQPSQTESLTFDSDGHLTYWRRSWSNSKPSETETFTYDSDERLTSWRRSWSDSTPTESASITYTGASRVPSGIRTDGAGASGAAVIDCRR